MLGGAGQQKPILMPHYGQGFKAGPTAVIIRTTFNVNPRLVQNVNLDIDAGGPPAQPPDPSCPGPPSGYPRAS